MGRLDGKVAFVSGGAGGMGAAIANGFAAEGARVMVGDLAGDAAVGEGVGYVQHDVTDEPSWGAALAATTAEFGRLDVLVNNAGILSIAPVVMTTAEEFMRTTEVNQLGVFLGMKAAIPLMAGNGGGSIINISSVAGLTGPAAHAAYAASKWAVRGMTKVAALEVGSAGIRVNSIHPGLIETPMLGAYRDMGVDPAAIAPNLPLGRLGTPADVVPLAVFLASDESGYCTASEFVVDGGFSGGPLPRS